MSKLKNKLASSNTAWRAGALCLLVLLSACAHPFGKNDFDQDGIPILKPTAKLAIDYPNIWQYPDFIALTPDGRHLIDASMKARNIRVWDWQQKKLDKQLLLNEKMPESHWGIKRDSPEYALSRHDLGEEVVLSPDGERAAFCVNKRTTELPKLENYTIARVWDLKSGEVVADIAPLLRNLQGFDREYVAQITCKNISFSPDGQYIAVTGSASVFDKEADLLNFAAKDDDEEFLRRHSSITLFEAKSGRFLKYLYIDFSKNKYKKKNGGLYKGDVVQQIGSPALFTSDTKQLLAMVFKDQYGMGEGGRGLWMGNYIARWDVETGIALESQDVAAKLSDPHFSGQRRIFWNWLPGQQEVWFETDGRYNNVVDQAQTEEESKQHSCATSEEKLSFSSEVAENCAYKSTITVMNMSTGKLRYLVPARKNPNLTKRLNLPASYGFLKSVISPDGNYAISHNLRKVSSKNYDYIKTIELVDLRTQQVKGRYSVSGRNGLSLPVFSGDSKYFATKVYERGWTGLHQNTSALIFDLSEFNKN